MHNFWLGLGTFLLIVSAGVLTLVGGIMGIPTILNVNLATPPNLLQSIQVTGSVIGLVGIAAGMA